MNETGRKSLVPDVVMDVGWEGCTAGEEKPDSASDETSHLPEDDGVEDGRAHANTAVVGLVPVEEVHQFPMKKHMPYLTFL